MTFKTYEINVDLVHDTSTTCSNRFSQNDRNSAKLLVTITNKGEELDLSKAKSVRMSFKKPDGTRVFQNDCQPINAMKGKYQILLKTQTLTAVGNVIAQIHIEEEDRIIDTQKFFFIVNDSLASDEAIESTNEFTIIKKALELGEKFKNVDFDPIIAAGELAKGAVKKSGDTMSGDLTIERNDTGKYVRWSNKNAQEYSLGTAVNGIFELYDAKGKLSPLTYNPTTKEFNINTATNLVKKTGDTMTGNLLFDVSGGGNKGILFRDVTNNKNVVAIDANTSGLSAWDSVNDKSIFDYNVNTKKFTVNADTNLVKKTGGDISGRLNLSEPNPFMYRPPGNRWWLQIVSAAGIEFTPSATADKEDWQWTKTIRLNPDGTIRQGKDGRASLTLTADATTPMTGNEPRAIRRGNTVTLIGSIRRNSGSTGNIVTTLPADMRPVEDTNFVAQATDGTAVQVFIGANSGNVTFSVPDKHVLLCQTYVVN